MDSKKCIYRIRSAIKNASHAGPPDANIFQSTSVMALFLFSDQAELLFIQKADVQGYPWANQMAFPGGHREKRDKTTLQTALRELGEEMGIQKDNVDVIGSLGHFQTINNKDIEAWVGIWNQEEKIKIDPLEISRVFRIPLRYLIDTHKEKRFHLETPNVMTLIYPYEDVEIWGVTAWILYHLIQILIKEK